MEPAPSDSVGAASPHGRAGPGDLDQPAEPAVLPSDAYPRDEPMQSDMAEYRQAFEPNLSLEERHLLNAVRGDCMAAEAGLLTLAGVLSRSQRMASCLAEFLLRCCRELEEAAQQAAGQEAASEEAGAEAGATRRRWAGRPALAASLLRTATGWDLLTGHVVPLVAKFLDQHMATLNILMWIFLLEIFHKISAWFALVGWEPLTLALQGITAPFLIRCYYALVASLCGPHLHHPAFHSLRTMGVSAWKGFASPGAMRPPVLHMAFLARIIMLMQVAYMSWVVAMQDSLTRFWGATQPGALVQSG